MIIEQILIGGFDIFCYVLGDPETGEGIVVDPGGPADQILERANIKGVSKVQLIVNTHSHVDHVSGNEAMHQATGAPIAIHEQEATGLANPTQPCWLCSERISLRKRRDFSRMERRLPLEVNPLR